MVVARVRLNRVDTHAYAQCFRLLFDTVKKDHPKFAVGENLLGIVMDWSDQQFNGLAETVGKEVAETVAKGCQVGQITLKLHLNTVCGHSI